MNFVSFKQISSPGRFLARETELLNEWQATELVVLWCQLPTKQKYS